MCMCMCVCVCVCVCVSARARACECAFVCPRDKHTVSQKVVLDKMIVLFFSCKNVLAFVKKSRLK